MAFRRLLAMLIVFLDRYIQLIPDQLELDLYLKICPK